MTNTNPSTIDPDLLGEFLDEMQEKCDAATQDLIEMEHNPSDQDILNRLFRDVHTAKGNLALLNIDELIPLFQGIEDVLDGLRQGTFPFSTLLSDALLLSFDRAFAAAAKFPVQGPEAVDLPYLNSIGERLRLISHSKKGETESQLKSLIMLIDPSTRLQPDQPDSETSQDSQRLQQQNLMSSSSELVERFGLVLNNDLLFFIGVAQQMEVRSPYWYGRSERMGLLALAMNEHAGTLVVPEQLFCAVLLHDLGMAFQPLSLLHKEGAFSEEERYQIQSHVNVGFECLRRMPDWQSAARMILQHQERCDGSGYPLMLKGDQIDDGAKILAIIDTFDARTHERAHVDMPNRPFMRAILEINRHAGIALDQMWVDHFNEVVKNLEKNTLL
jgi:HD-GYP domain-containing protein (c-di-GMP phosphodiesterase class II)/HPt (histidine-containing phosphotransfer) domain-containing protein